MTTTMNQSLTLTHHKPEPIPVPPDAEIPCISEMQVWRSLLSLKETATSPDQISFWIWKDHDEIITPIAEPYS